MANVLMMDYLRKLTFFLVRSTVSHNKNLIVFEKHSLKLKECHNLHIEYYFSLLTTQLIYASLCTGKVGLFFRASTSIFVSLGKLKSPSPLNLYWKIHIEMLPLVSALLFLIFHRNIWWMDNKGFTRYQNNFSSCMFVHMIHIVFWNINHSTNCYLNQYWYVKPLLLRWVDFNQSMDK